MVNNQKFLFNACLTDSWKQICEKLKHWHLHGFIIGGVARALDKDRCCGCDRVDKRTWVHHAPILMWSIHDLPTYGVLSNQVTKWYIRCCAYGPHTLVHQSRNLGKVVYCGHCRWLHLNHPYKSNRCDFNGKVKRRLASPVMSGLEHLTNVKLFESWKSTSILGGSPICKDKSKTKEHPLWLAILEGPAHPFSICHTIVLYTFFTV